MGISHPTVPADAGGSGGTEITTLPFSQPLAQARGKWSGHQADAIWSAAIIKLVLESASDSSGLQDLTTLIEARDEDTDSLTLGDQGTRPNQRSVQVPVLPPATSPFVY